MLWNEWNKFQGIEERADNAKRPSTIFQPGFQPGWEDQTDKTNKAVGLEIIKSVKIHGSRNTETMKTTLRRMGVKPVMGVQDLMRMVKKLLSVQGSIHQVGWTRKLPIVGDIKKSKLVGVSDQSNYLRNQSRMGRRSNACKTYTQNLMRREREKNDIWPIEVKAPF